MLGLEILEFEKLGLPSLKIPRIFIANDAIAFFDVYNPKTKPIDVSTIVKRSTKVHDEQQYNYMVASLFEGINVEYFDTHNYEEEIRTVSVTTPCIIFCAYTNNGDGTVRSSGVFHSLGNLNLREGLDKLINGVKSNSNEKIIIKAAGGDTEHRNTKDLDEIRDYLRMLQKNDGVFTDPAYLLFEKGSWRVTEFNPRSGQLITYLNKEDKTIL